MAEQLIYVNGKFVPRDQACVSVFDHGFLYGDGVFEGIRAYNGRVFRLKDHIERFYDSAAAIGLDLGLSREEMSDVVTESCAVNDLANAYIRLVASRGAGDLGLSPKSCKKPTIVCIAGQIALYPQSLYDNGLEMVTASTTRNFVNSLNPRVKSLNYLNNILAKIEADRAGSMEALMINDTGYVVECTGDNIFLWRHGRLITPPAWMGALEGITRKTVLELARGMGLPVAEEPVSRFDVYSAEEMFLTGTAAELIPVVNVDARKIGDGKPGPMFKKLLEAFRERTKETDGAAIRGQA
ncbi:MAG: branched-chain-amino-acid transaminase [Fibrobacterales bacterium]|nr:branched-chain-amino-acid transaminase [Fibrobacterales bacterium]MBP5187912.1 branched-chain-amino-acid transaminase [Fibrobacterales bacterium]